MVLSVSENSLLYLKNLIPEVICSIIGDTLSLMKFLIALVYVKNINGSKKP